MIDKNMLEAELEAKRFLKKVKEYKETENYGTDRFSWVPCKERATVKRASMDLTRALSKMRNK